MLGQGGVGWVSRVLNSRTFSPSRDRGNKQRQRQSVWQQACCSTQDRTFCDEFLTLWSRLQTIREDSNSTLIKVLSGYRPMANWTILFYLLHLQLHEILTALHVNLWKRNRSHLSSVNHILATHLLLQASLYPTSYLHLGSGYSFDSNMINLKFGGLATCRPAWLCPFSLWRSGLSQV